MTARSAVARYATRPPGPQHPDPVLVPVEDRPDPVAGGRQDPARMPLGVRARAEMRVVLEYQRPGRDGREALVAHDHPLASLDVDFEQVNRAEVPEHVH